jgi:hypothetical protein
MESLTSALDISDGEWDQAVADGTLVVGRQDNGTVIVVVAP